MMSGLIQGDRTQEGAQGGNNNNNHHLQNRKDLFNSLIATVKLCETRYAGKSELATEQDLTR